jgi:FkbM family methyltransferase
MPANPQKRRIGVTAIEAVALCILVAAVTVSVYRYRLQPHFFFSEPALGELEAFETKYGPGHFSMGLEEWFVRDYFQDKRDGVFLDVGANHYKDRNNTYYLESALGWSGIAVDALEEFAADYRTHRPRTRFVAMFASDVADTRVQFFVPDNNLVSSANREFVDKYDSDPSVREVPTTTLTAVLDQAGVAKIDYMSMDIEMAEPKALAGFDIDRFKPELVCIEAHEQIRQHLIDYFARHGYVVVGKYLRVDPHNLYFHATR